jgi:hypothetical protein
MSGPSDQAATMDLETVFHAEGSPTAEVETLLVKNLLGSNGIPAVVVGDPVLPNLPFEVKVARHHMKRAHQLIAEAKRNRKRKSD